MQPDYVYKEMSEPEMEYGESMFLVTLAFMLASQPHHFLHLGVRCWWQKSAELLYALTIIIYILHASFKLLKCAWC